MSKKPPKTPSKTSSQAAPEKPLEPSLATPAEPRRRPPYLAIAAATMLFVFALNGAWMLWNPRPPVEPPPPPIGEVLAPQIAAVVAGESETIEITDREIRDQDLEPLRNLVGLHTLIFDSGNITDLGLEVIATLPDLSHLRLRESPITDAGIGKLLANENLRVLNLPHARLSPEGVAELAGLPRLRQVRFGGGEAGDLSRGVAQLKHLRSVHLIDVPVTDEGLKTLASLPQLESLYLDNPSVTEAGWQWLFEHHPELHVHLNQQHHDRDPARHAHHTPETEG